MASPQAKILHISDLHFGSGFDRHGWRDLCRIATELSVDFVIVTGDLVNSPFYWTLKNAKKNLEDLLAQIRKKNDRCTLIVVPGNHDTRFSGLVPIHWLVGILLISGFATGALLWLSFRTGDQIFWYVLIGLAFLCAVVAILSLIIRVLTRNFAEVFADRLLSLPKTYPCEQFDIVLFPFDSATAGISAARGKIGKEQFGWAKELKIDNEAPGRPQYRIALLHHHALPIPYDNRQEELLVLHNAGAFLNEMSLLKIRLILHGHKHRRHFGRVTMNAGQDNSYEVGVLSTGTPTAGHRPPYGGYHFNFVVLDENWNANVTPYESHGGTFTSGTRFKIENAELVEKRIYEEIKDAETECESAVTIVEINPDGDAYHRDEYRGFTVKKEGVAVDGIPHPITVTVQPGSIEKFRADPLGDDGPVGTHLKPDLEKFKVRSQSGSIKFGKEIEKGDRAVSCVCHYHTINSYAMSPQHYRLMYNSKETPIESASVKLTGTAFRELVVIIQFPPKFKLGSKPNLLVESITGKRDSYLERKYEAGLFYDLRLNLVFFRVSYPHMGMKYTIQWKLADEVPPASYAAAILTGESEEIAREFLKIPQPCPEDHPIYDLLTEIRNIAVDRFRLSEEKELQVSLMIYDSVENMLRTVAANFPQRKTIKLSYGDGIAGRAYKMNKSRIFVKRYAITEETPVYYYPSDMEPIVSPSQIEEEVLLAIPIRHPSDARAVYGVANIGSKKASSKLADLRNDEYALDKEYAEFVQLVSVLCYQHHE